MTKEELLAILNEPRSDEERAHSDAEKAILAYLNDPEITDAWHKAADVQNWWYA